MKYVKVLLLLLFSVYMFSFVKYNWNKKNKMAAAGITLLTIASIVIPLIFIFGG